MARHGRDVFVLKRAQTQGVGNIHAAALAATWKKWRGNAVPAVQVHHAHPGFGLSQNPGTCPSPAHLGSSTVLLGQEDCLFNGRFSGCGPTFIFQRKLSHSGGTSG